MATVSKYPFKAWSYSALTAFEDCPRRYFLTRIAKAVKEEESEAIRWGNFVHKALEDRIREKTPLPETIQRYEKYVTKLEALPGTLEAEQKIALTENMEQVTFFDRRVWLRCVLDISFTNAEGTKALIADWKTGKNIPSDDQLDLFAAVGFTLNPTIQEIKAGYVMLKINRIPDPVKYHREQLPELWQRFMPRVERLKKAHEKVDFPAKPSGLCRKWCPVGKDNCEFCGW